MSDLLKMFEREERCPFCGWTDGEHAPGCGYDCDDIPITHHAQGGGLVVWDESVQWYVFVENAPVGYEVGDVMPQEWGIAR